MSFQTQSRGSTEFLNFKNTESQDSLRYTKMQREKFYLPKVCQMKWGRGGINSFQKQKRKQRRKTWVMSTKQATELLVAACILSTGNAVQHRMLLAHQSIVPLDRGMTHGSDQYKALLRLYIDMWHTHNCYNMSGLSSRSKIPVESRRVANIIQFRFIFCY